MKQFERENRLQVKYFISDMWKPYTELASTYFKNATQVVDKYHYIRQIVWAFERVRKNVQKKYVKDNRLQFKHSKRILTKRNSKLKPHQQEQVEYLMYLSDDLRSACGYRNFKRFRNRILHMFNYKLQEKQQEKVAVKNNHSIPFNIFDPNH